MHNKNIPFVYSEEVADALNEGRPVVALESNVITHGFSYPDNIITGEKVKEAVKRAGATPATIGLDNGKILVGMTSQDIERFATAKDVPKVSNRDIPVILAQKKKGATTVASTVFIAELANIGFFASAGIGGVHKGAEKSMDISADLIQFTRSKMVVVCAGAKNILDLGLTMEYLETQGVPVISYQYDDFPAFYCKSSNIRSPHRIDELSLMAKTIYNHRLLGSQNSILITKPIEDADAIDSKEIEAITEQAIIDAEKSNIVGNAITKYLLRTINEKTEGRASMANMSVLISNAEFAAQLAVEYSSL